jgi:4-hydroxyphenylpyruvate dioxygenase-like putative hemolysin
MTKAVTHDGNPCKSEDAEAVLFNASTCVVPRSMEPSEYDWLADPKPEGFGYLDHLTHNGFCGNMDKWVTFYTELFNFR